MNDEAKKNQYTAKQTAYKMAYECMSCFYQNQIERAKLYNDSFEYEVAFQFKEIMEDLNKNAGY